MRMPRPIQQTPQEQARPAGTLCRAGQRVLFFAGPGGVDIVIDALGGPFTGQAIGGLARGGRAVVMGYSAGPETTLRVTDLVWKLAQVSLRGRCSDVADTPAATVPGTVELKGLPAAEPAPCATVATDGQGLTGGIGGRRMTGRSSSAELHRNVEGGSGIGPVGDGVFSAADIAAGATAPRHRPHEGPLRVLVGKERFSENHAWSEMPLHWPARVADRAVIEVVGQGRLEARLVDGGPPVDVVVPLWSRLPGRAIRAAGSRSSGGSPAEASTAWRGRPATARAEAQPRQRRLLTA